MTMFMYIVMNMNIYINKRNTDRLNTEPNKSGLINKLLDEHYTGNGPLIPEKKSLLPDGKDEFEGASEAGVSFGSTPPGPNGFKQILDDLEKSCCRGSSPCKHWVWDSSSGEKYINSLSGREREA